jgi:hypothetical protein
LNYNGSCCGWKSPYQYATPAHAGYRLCKPPVLGVCQEFRSHSEDEISDDVQGKPIGDSGHIYGRTPFFITRKFRIIAALPRIQNVNEDVDVSQYLIFEPFQVLPAEELRMNLSFEPHQPVLSASDEIRCTPADTESCVPLVLGHIRADAVDVGVSAGVVERERVWRDPYYRSCGSMSASGYSRVIIQSSDDTVSQMPFVRLFVQVTPSDKERRVP